MLQVIILCGIPTSGKSTWREDFMKGHRWTWKVISRDDIRYIRFGPNYKPNSKREEEINKWVEDAILKHTHNGYNILIDNTSCKEDYIDAFIKRFEKLPYIVKVKYFPISLWKAYYRNIIRYLSTGKWIPFKVIRNMKKGYDKINKNKYQIFKEL